MKLIALINKGIAIYNEMEAARFFPSLRNQKPQKAKLIAIRDEANDCTPQLIAEKLQALYKEVSEQSPSSKIARTVQLLTVCANTEIASITPSQALTDIEKITDAVKTTFSGWTYSDPEFVSKFEALANEARAFISSFVKNTDLAKAINDLAKSTVGEQLVAAEQVLSAQRQGLETAAAAFDAAEATRTAIVAEMESLRTKLNELNTPAEVGSVTPPAAAMPTPQPPTITQQDLDAVEAKKTALLKTLQYTQYRLDAAERQLSRADIEKSDMTRDLRRKLVEIDDLRKQKESDEQKIRNARLAVERLESTERSNTHKIQELSHQVETLSVTLQERERELREKEQFIVCLPSELGNFKADDIAKIKELMKSELSFAKKYQNVVQQDCGASQHWVDTFYSRYNSVYHCLFNGKPVDSILDPAFVERGDLDEKKIQASIINYYPLATVASTIKKTNPLNAVEAKYQQAVEASSNLKRALAEFGEEVMKRIHNVRAGTVKDLYKRLEPFIRRNLKYLQSQIQEELKKEARNNREFAALAQPNAADRKPDGAPNEPSEQSSSMLLGNK